MTDDRGDWRRWLRWKIAGLLLFKLAALIVLWLLFFSPAHRVSVDPEGMSERVAPSKRIPAQSTITNPAKDDPDDA